MLAGKLSVCLSVWDGSPKRKGKGLLRKWLK